MERNKHWRELQRKKFYIAALKRISGWWFSDTMWIFLWGEHLSWEDLYKANAYKAYRSVRVPCSCECCTGPNYNRVDFRKETGRILREAEKELDLPSGYMGKQSVRWK